MIDNLVVLKKKRETKKMTSLNFLGNGTILV